MSGEYCHYITCAQSSADCWAELATHNVVLSASFCNACGQINPEFHYLSKYFSTFLSFDSRRFALAALESSRAGFY